MFADICYEENTSMDQKGSITWPNGVMGQRVYVRCPYAFDFLTHASRTCLYDDKGRKIYFVYLFVL